MKALSAKPVARVGGNGFWDPLRLEAYKLQWALIPNPGPLHESPLGINHNSFKIAGKATGPEKTSTPHGVFFKYFFSPHSILIPPKYVFIQAFHALWAYSCSYQAQIASPEGTGTPANM